MKHCPRLDRLVAVVLLVCPFIPTFTGTSSAEPTQPVAVPSGTPDPRLLDCSGNIESVNQALNQTLPVRTRISLLLLKARLLRDNHQIPDARQEGMKVLDEGIRSAVLAESQNPGQSWPWAMEGMLDLLKTQYLHFPKGITYGKRASRANNQALSYAPDDPSANLSKGLENYYKPWFVGGSYVKALSRFKKALSADPDNPRILSWTGLAYLALDRDQRGFAAIQKAAQLCPRNPIYQKRLLTRRPR